MITLTPQQAKTIIYGLEALELKLHHTVDYVKDPFYLAILNEQLQDVGQLKTTLKQYANHLRGV